MLSKDSPALKLIREAFEEGLEKAPHTYQRDAQVTIF